MYRQRSQLNVFWKIAAEAYILNDVVLVSLLLTWTYFTPCSSVSVVNFEHVITAWVAVNYFQKKLHYRYFIDVPREA